MGAAEHDALLAEDVLLLLRLHDVLLKGSRSNRSLRRFKLTLCGIFRFFGVAECGLTLRIKSMKNTSISLLTLTLSSSLFLQTFQGERFLAAVARRGRGTHEFHAAEPAHAERRQHVEVVQAHVLGREQCNGPLWIYYAQQENGAEVQGRRS